MLDGPDHPHDPPPPRFVLPPFAILWRGFALLGLGLAAMVAAVALIGRSPWLAPVALVPGLAALDSLWAALIHLTGGEWFDDHPEI